jgi:hypothetical protein
MQKVQLAAARERLKIDAAKARMIEDTASDSDVKLNQFGRPIVPYKDLPEIEAADQILLDLEFERLACPHWAVAKYRPGFGPKNELRKLSRNSWYFYETGQAILRQLVWAVMNEEIPDLLEKLSTPDLNVVDAFAGLLKYLELEDAAKKEAVILHRTTVEKMAIKDKAELAKIRKDLDARYEAIHKRNAERDNRPVKG